MRLSTVLLLGWFLTATSVTAAGGQTLDIYFIDTEGGQATLYVSPSGESLLADTGNPGPRDHGRMMEVIRLAGLQRLDHVWITHYHTDHHGGLEELAAAIPILNFYDHGPSSEVGRPNVDAFMARYEELTRGRNRTSVRPGDRIPFAGVDVYTVASHARVLDAPIPGARGAGLPNPACETFVEKDLSRFTDIDNDHSAGFVLTYGNFRTISLGDFMWNLEYDLMCPNKIGTVDLYLTSHHGLDRSGSPALVHGLQPRVAVMNNGPRKGGSPDTFDVLYTSPGFQDLWQLHWSYAAGVERNAPGIFIANLDEPEVLANVINPPPAPAGAQAGGGVPEWMTPADHSPAHYIKVSVDPDGSFTVTNSRNGFSKSYESRRD
jgi:competence protein ComEC